MKFRRIYWVTEHLDEAGQSHVAGIYTSIPDLLHKGIYWKEGVEYRSGFRLVLTKLDSSKPPFGVWTSPDFQEIEKDLSEYVQTGEFSEDDCDQLVAALREFGQTI